MKNNEDRENREKKAQKLEISISNHKIEFLHFLRFIVRGVVNASKRKKPPFKYQ